MNEFNTSLAYEQEIVTHMVAVKEGYDPRGNPVQQLTDPHGYGFALLAEEGAEEFVIRRYTFYGNFNKEEQSALKKELTDFGVTHAHRTDKGFVVYSLRDRVGAKLVARDWGDFRVLHIKEGELSEKLFKRLSVLGVRSYFYGTFNADDVTIKYIPKEGAHVDGEVYISRRLRDMVSEQVLVRMEDQDKAFDLVQVCDNTWTFSTFRALVPEGLIKGDAVVTQMDPGADIVVYKPNLKDEISSKLDGKIVVTMMPQKQGKTVRTNRQIMSLLGEKLYSDNLQMVKDAFSSEMNETLAKLDSGTYIPPFRESIEFDAIDGINDKVMNWLYSGLDLRKSRYLTNMLAEGIVTRNSPIRNEDRKRRFPVPHAAMYSIRSEHTYEMVYDKMCPVPLGGVLIDPRYGIFVSNSILEEFLEIAGGGDLDDKVELHARIASHADEHFGISAGQLVGVFTRNPMSVNSNGEDHIGVEYQIRPIYGPMVDQELGTFYGDVVPVFDVANRPLCVTEVEAGHELITPTPQKMADSYTKEFAWQKIVENIQDPFGGFVNVTMAFVALGIPFPFYATGETVVDICQQTRAAVDMLAIEEVVKRLRTNLLNHIIENQIEVDYYIARRSGIFDELTELASHLIGEGIFTDAVTTHRAIVAKFELRAKDLVKDIVNEVNHGAPAERKIGKMDSGAWMDMKIRKIRQGLERQTGRSYNAQKMRESERNELGDHIYDELMKLVEADDNKLTHDSLLQLIRDMFYWAHRVENNDKYPEKVLYYGDMFTLLVEALNQEG